MNEADDDQQVARAGVFKCIAAGLCVLLIVGAVCLVAADWIQSRLTMTGMRYVWVWAAKEGGVLGLFVPQVLLAATYSSLGDGSSLKRILYSMLVVTVFTFLLQQFTRWWFATSLNDSATTVLVVVFYFCLLQIPLWIFRVCSGWRISLGPGAVPERMRFSIMHMLGWSTFLSVPLCIVASLSELFQTGGAEVMVYIILWMLALAVTAIGAIYISLVVESVWKCAAAASLLWVAAVAVELCSIWMLGGRDTESVTVVIANVLGLSLFLCCLRTARGVGHRLLPFSCKIVDRPNRDIVAGA